MVKSKGIILTKYLQAYKKDPKSKVYAPLAETYRQLGAIKEAMDVLRKGLKNYPNDPLGNLVLANCHADRKQYKLAFEILSPFAQKYLENHRLQKLYAEICEELSYKKEAKRAYQCLNFIAPGNLFYKNKLKELNTNSQRNYNANFEYDRPLNRDDDVTSLNDIDSWQEIRGPNKVSNELENWSEVGLRDSIVEERVTRVVKEVGLKREQFVTHTLADIYESQGHLNKALEVLKKMKLLCPDDSNIDGKIVLLKEKIKKSKTLKDAPSQDLLQRPPLVNTSEKRDELAEVRQKYKQFLNLVKKRAKNCKITPAGI